MKLSFNIYIYKYKILKINISFSSKRIFLNLAILKKYHYLDSNFKRYHGRLFIHFKFIPVRFLLFLRCRISHMLQLEHRYIDGNTAKLGSVSPFARFDFYTQLHAMDRKQRHVSRLPALSTNYRLVCRPALDAS